MALVNSYEVKRSQRHLLAAIEKADGKALLENNELVIDDVII